MKNPTIYLDTNILSAYWYEGGDVLALGRRILTREWWDSERAHFALRVSSVTEEELGSGKFPRQADCLKMARRLPYLPVSTAVRDLAQELLSSRVVPASKPGDALQMAVAAIHGMDYLLTWNYAHLANPAAQERLGRVCQGYQLRLPFMVSPETIPKASLGQVIRRRR